MNTEIGLISVIMAAYNSEKTIAEAITSVLIQTYTNLELIIVDDCSTDYTAEIIKNFIVIDKRVKYIKNNKNLGTSLTRHTALNVAKGNWIAFLDSDDKWQPTKLYKQIEKQKLTNADLVFTASSFINSNGEKKDWILHVPLQVKYKQLLKQNVISNSSVIVKKELVKTYESIGDEMHEDFACWLRILRTGVVAYGVDEPLLVYRLSSTSKSGNKIKSAKMNWNTYRYVGINPISSLYYMAWYTVRSLKKYKNLK